MKKTKPGDTIYYKSEMDEFSGVESKPRLIADDYQYINNGFFYKLGRFFVYRIIMTPIAFFYMKLKFHSKVIGKEKLKGFKKKGYFMYANHTQLYADAYQPNVVCFPKSVYPVVYSDKVGMKGMETAMKMVGAMPLPSTMHGIPNFMKALEKRAVTGNVIMIYPEARVWPYYTGVRDFPAVSFKYPVRFQDACFCMTNCYKKRKFGKKPRMVTYIDGPFYPDLNLPERERNLDLRNKIHDCMVKRTSEESDYEVVHYIKEDAATASSVTSLFTNELNPKIIGACDKK